jgi:hypothetical protein
MVLLVKIAALTLSRGPNADTVDLAFDRESQGAELGQPRVAILILNKGDDADHPSRKVARNRGTSQLVPSVDHISSTVHGSVHVLDMAEAGRGDPNLDSPGQVARLQTVPRLQHQHPTESVSIAYSSLLTLVA